MSCFENGDRSILRNITEKEIQNVEQNTRTNPLRRANKKTSFVYLTKEVFLNDVCLRQMMSASPNDVRCANDVCLAAHWANIASLRVKRATSYLRSKCIISPQGDASFEDIQGFALIYLRKCGIIDSSINKNLTR